jgi:hypothetical protein
MARSRAALSLSVPEFDEAWRDEHFPDPRARRGKLRAYDGGGSGREAPPRVVDWADEVGMERISREPHPSEAAHVEAGETRTAVEYDRRPERESRRVQVGDFDWPSERESRRTDTDAYGRRADREPPRPTYERRPAYVDYDDRDTRSERATRATRATRTERATRSELATRSGRDARTERAAPTERDMPADRDTRSERVDRGPEPSPNRVPGADGVPGRRTVTIRGQVAPRPSDRRPARRADERLGSRPDRIAMWAVLLCVVMILVAATSSHAAVLDFHHLRAPLHHAHATVTHLARGRARYL